MSEFPLNIDPKEDLPEKLDQVKNLDPKYWTSAAEANKMVRALEELNTVKATKDELSAIATGEGGPLYPNVVGDPATLAGIKVSDTPTYAAPTADLKYYPQTPETYRFDNGAGGTVDIVVSSADLDGNTVVIFKVGNVYTKQVIAGTVPEDVIREADLTAPEINEPGKPSDASKVALRIADVIEETTLNRLQPSKYTNGYSRNTSTGALVVNSSFSLSNRILVVEGKTYKRVNINTSYQYYKFLNNVYVGFGTGANIEVDDTFNQVETIVSNPASGTEMFSLLDVDTSTYIPYKYEEEYKVEKLPITEREVSQNLLNPSGFQAGRVRNRTTGAIATSAGFTLSNRMSVSEGEIYKRVNVNTTYDLYKFLNGSYVGWQSGGTVTVDETFNQVEIVMQNPAPATAMFTLNSIDTSVFLPYYDNYVIKEDALPASIKETNAVNPELYWTDKIGLIENEVYTIYKSSIIRETKDIYKTLLYVALDTPIGGTRPRIYKTGLDDITFNSADANNGLNLWLRDLSNTSKNQLVVAPLTKVAANVKSGQTLRPLLIADSLGNRGTIKHTIDYATEKSAGITWSPIGTATNTGYPGEGREGWTFKNFYGGSNRHEFTNDVIYSPFLKLADSADKTNHPEWCFQRTDSANELNYTEVTDIGQDFYIFDLEDYLSKNSFPNPTHVPIALNTNDITAYGADAVNTASLGIEIMISQIRAARPSVPVGVVNATAKAYNTSSTYREQQFDVANAIQKKITDLAFSDVTVIPVAAFQTGFFNFPTGTLTNLNTTGNYTQNAPAGDNIHFKTEGYRPYAQLMLGWILNN